ncbi:MAG: tetratricopeptide repeat protein [Candidatus Eremiobacteraeota bacterium]|nr:tetratricopeptide repeat protein [Candidatus Eremiobacteraeota bacterium]
MIVVYLLEIFLASLLLFYGCAGKEPSPVPIIKSPGVDATDVLIRPDDSVPLDTPDDIRKALETGSPNLEKALATLNPLIKDNPGDTSLLLLKARLLWSKGDFEEARDITDIVLTKNPGDVSALALKTQLLEEHFNNEEAI